MESLLDHLSAYKWHVAIFQAYLWLSTKSQWVEKKMYLLNLYTKLKVKLCLDCGGKIAFYFPVGYKVSRRCFLHIERLAWYFPRAAKRPWLSEIVNLMRTWVPMSSMCVWEDVTQLCSLLLVVWVGSNCHQGLIKPWNDWPLKWSPFWTCTWDK